MSALFTFKDAMSQETTTIVLPHVVKYTQDGNKIKVFLVEGLSSVASIHDPEEAKKFVGALANYYSGKT